MSEPALQTGAQPGNALIAQRVDTTTWYSGIGIAETIDMTIDGVRSGSWIDTGLGGVGTVTETAVWALDPFGALVAAGFGYAVEHVRPLSDALDWLAGDPDQVDANARTWRNVSVELSDVGDLYSRAIRQQVPDWEGPASAAYRAQSVETVEITSALGSAADGVAIIVAMSGSLVSLTRTLVRDLIGELVSVLVVRIPLWTLQSAGTFGLATPYVEAQISALVAKWAARIARLLRALITSLRNLATSFATLDDALSALSRLLNRRSGTAYTSPGITTSGTRAGAGGNWPTIDETPGGAIAQIDNLSCAAAAGQMLSGRTQQELIGEMGGVPASPEELAAALGKGWSGGYVGPENLPRLNQSPPWAAMLHDEGADLGHMVVVDGVDPGGRLMIRDPWGQGTSYKMDLDAFLHVWNGNAVLRR